MSSARSSRKAHGTVLPESPEMVAELAREVSASLASDVKRQREDMHLYQRIMAPLTRLIRSDSDAMAAIAELTERKRRMAQTRSRVIRPETARADFRICGPTQLIIQTTNALGNATASFDPHSFNANVFCNGEGSSAASAGYWCPYIPTPGFPLAYLYPQGSIQWGWQCDSSAGFTAHAQGVIYMQVYSFDLAGQNGRVEPIQPTPWTESLNTLAWWAWQDSAGGIAEHHGNSGTSQLAHLDDPLGGALLQIVAGRQYYLGIWSTVTGEASGADALSSGGMTGTDVQFEVAEL